MESMTPEDMGQMTQATNEALSTGQANVPINPEMPSYSIAQQTTPTVDTGMDNYTAGLEGNEINPMQGLI